MKKLIFLIAIGLLLTACGSSTPKEPLLYECIRTDDTGYGEYVEEYIVFTMNDKDEDEIDTEHVFANYYFTYEMTDEEVTKMSEDRDAMLKNVDHIDFTSKAGKRMFQEDVKYQYKDADLSYFVDEGIIQKTEDGRVPDYISYDLSREYYEENGFKCQKFVDEASSYKNDLITPDFTDNLDVLPDNVPELEVDYRNDPTGVDVDVNDADVLNCVYADPNNPNLKNEIVLTGSQQLNTLYIANHHEEYAIGTDVDLAQLESNARDRGLLLNSLQGFNYAYEIDEANNLYRVTMTADYDSADMQQLVDNGIVGLVDGVVPDHILLTPMIETLQSQGYTCTP